MGDEKCESFRIQNPIVFYVDIFLVLWFTKLCDSIKTVFFYQILKETRTLGNADSS
jgi:hypothetical protein